MEWSTGVTGSTGDESHPLIRLGNLSRSDGSAILSQGETTLQVAVFGPGDVAMHKEIPDRATVEIITKSARRSKESSPEDKTRRDFIRSILQSIIYTEFYPKSLIQLIIQELESDQPIMAHSVNACCTALLDSGISMKTTVAAVTFAVMPGGTTLPGKSSKILLKVNPSNEDMEDCLGVVTLVYESSSRDVCGIHFDKGFSQGLSADQLSLCLTQGRKETESIFDKYREVCTNSFQ